MVYFNHVVQPLVNRPFIKQLDRTDGHYYLTESGKIYPSITTVLKIETDEAIKHWIARVGEVEANRIIKESQDVGTALHKYYECFLSNKSLPEMDQTKFAKSPFELFEDTKYAFADVDNIYALETKLYSDEMGLAGTVDCIAEYEGELSVIDFKNSRKPKTKSRAKNYFLQICAYAKMWKECMNQDINQGVIIIANWDGTTTIFKFNPHDFENKLWNVLIKWETLGL